MNLSKISIIIEDEILRGVKSRHVWLFGAALAFICILAMHYSASIAFLFPNLERIPYTYVSFMTILLIGPFFILITAFDSISSEIETGTIRYIVSKIDRASFILGKFLFLFLIFTFFTFVVAVMGQVYNYQSGNSLELGKAISFWLLSSLYIGCFISIFIFVSTLSETNKIAFTMSAILLAIIMYFFLQGDIEILKQITPYHYAFAVLDNMKYTLDKTVYFDIFRNLFSLLFFIVATLSIDIFTFKRREL
jgi:ABC-2 type transport system permease protein